MKEISSSIYKTQNISATYIYRNHLYELLDKLEKFAVSYPDYVVFLVSDKSKRVIGTTDIINYIYKNEPSSLYFRVRHKTKDISMGIDIENGITLFLNNGSYLLYGFYNTIVDYFDLIKVHSALSFMRRYWLYSLTFSFVFVPLIVGRLITGKFLWWWVFVSILIIIAIGYFVYSYFVEAMDNLFRTKALLPTKMYYYKYSNKLGSPVFQLLSSLKTLISLITATATIISFVLLFKS